MDNKGEIVEIAVIVKRVTDKALLVNHGVPKEEWIPKSQIAIEKGMV